MKIVFRKPYIYWTIGIFFLYVILNLILSGFYKTLKLILIYASTVDWFKLFISVSLSLIIGMLIAVNAVYLYIRHNERKICLESRSITGIRAIGGLATGFCPLCVTGLFPLMLGFFGVSFSFATLPFGGIEIQALAVLMLLFSLRLLLKQDIQLNKRKEVK